jgi:hypothetical protein
MAENKDMDTALSTILGMAAELQTLAQKCQTLNREVFLADLDRCLHYDVAAEARIALHDEAQRETVVYMAEALVQITLVLERVTEALGDHLFGYDGNGDAIHEFSPDEAVHGLLQALGAESDRGNELFAEVTDLRRENLALKGEPIPPVDEGRSALDGHGQPMKVGDRIEVYAGRGALHGLLGEGVVISIVEWDGSQGGKPGTLVRWRLDAIPDPVTYADRCRKIG